MGKNLLQDIVPPDKRSIRNVPVPKRRKTTDSVSPKSKKPKEPDLTLTEPELPVRKEPMESSSPEPLYESKNRTASSVVEDHHSEPASDAPADLYNRNAFSAPHYNGGEGGYKRRRRKGARLFLILFGLVVVGMGFLAVSSFFVSAKVTVSPLQEKVELDHTFVAERKPLQGGLGFDTVSVTLEEGKAVSATDEEHMERKASGRIIIYNEFDKNSQRLIKNTRFETPDGLIYRIQESVVVPGKGDDGLPGSIEVTVYADAPGDRYNIGQTDFTIPGFKGDPRFETFYARSKTEMTGGFVGMVKKVSESVREETRVELQATLREKLRNEISGKVPGTHITYDDAIFFEFEPAPQSEASSSSVKINERGVAHVIMFNKEDLENYIARSVTSDFIAGAEIIGIEGASFSIHDKNLFDPQADTSFTFDLKGETVVVARFNEEEILAELSGASKNDLPQIMAKYPAIGQAEAMISPFWKRTFPADPADITLIKEIAVGQDLP